MSDQYLSAPRELLEHLHQHEDCPVEFIDALRRVLAAPAEDVRAMVDEPVPFGYWRVPNDAPLQGMFLSWEVDGPYGNSDSHIANAVDAGFTITKLYRHAAPLCSEVTPQCLEHVRTQGPRKVVMPEREIYSRYFLGIIPENRFEVEAYKDGWNACLDEIERLNGDQS